MLPGPSLVGCCRRTSGVNLQVTIGPPHELLRTSSRDTAPRFVQFHHACDVWSNRSPAISSGISSSNRLLSVKPHGARRRSCSSIVYGTLFLLVWRENTETINIASAWGRRDPTELYNAGAVFEARVMVLVVNGGAESLKRSSRHGRSCPSGFIDDLSNSASMWIGPNGNLCEEHPHKRRDLRRHTTSFIILNGRIPHPRNVPMGPCKDHLRLEERERANGSGAERVRQEQ